MKYSVSIAMSSTRKFWIYFALGLIAIVVGAIMELAKLPGAELPCILGFVLVMFGPTKLPGLGQSLKVAWDEFNKSSGGGFGPPGVPVESALYVPVQPKWKDTEPPLPPL